MKLQLLKQGKNRVKMKTKSAVLDNSIRECFTVPNKNARHSQYAGPTSSPITPRGSFKAGITMEIINFIKDKFPACDIDTSDIDNILHPFSIKIKTLHELPNTKDFEKRDYQDEAVSLALENGRGTFEMATSAGKSYIITKLIHNIWLTSGKKRVLILVPNIGLVKQFYGDILEYGIDEKNVCMFSSSSKGVPEAPLIISNRQWLERHSNELPDIHVSIIDEAHMLKGTNKICKFVESLPLSRYAFTGTLPADAMDSWNVLGICGPLLKTTKAKNLQEQGYIAKIDIRAIHLKHNVPQPRKPVYEVLEEHPEYKGNSEKIALEIAKARFPLEWRFIEDSKKANLFICKMSLKIKGNSIILFDHTSHGKELESIMRGLTDRTVYFINGETSLNEREEIRKQMELDTDIILIGNTKCIGTGMNIKSIDNIIFAFTSGTSNVKIIQAVGRALRLKEGKTKMTLYDIFHSFRYSSAHYEERKILYQDNYNIKSFKKVSVDL